MSIAMTCPTLGVVFGYSMTSYIIGKGGVWETEYKFHWWQSFRIQSVISLVIAAIAIIIPRKYLNINEVV